MGCNNKHIRSFFHKLRKITPRGKSLWSSLISNISWKEAWRLTFKYVISNKVKEMQHKILHYIYPTNTYLSRFVEIDPKCEFCNIEEETIQPLFFECQYTAGFWRKIEDYFKLKTKMSLHLGAKDILFYFENESSNIRFIVNLIILIAKFHIHKAKFSKSLPSFVKFQIEFKKYCETIEKIENKKCLYSINVINELITNV